MKRLIYFMFSIICISAFADTLMKALKLNDISEEEMDYTYVPALAPPTFSQHGSAEGHQAATCISRKAEHWRKDSA